jgi:hypothetical protein
MIEEREAFLHYCEAPYPKGPQLPYPASINGSQLFPSCCPDYLADHVLRTNNPWIYAVAVIALGPDAFSNRPNNAVYHWLLSMRKQKKNDIAASYWPTTIRFYLQQIMLAQCRVHTVTNMGAEKDLA